MKHWKVTEAPEGAAYWSCRRCWIRQELRVRENYLEHRVILGRWRRVTRIQDGWVYLEQIRPQCYRLRVRGEGGQVVLTNQTVLGWDENAVPERMVLLAQQIAQRAAWPLDVPHLLRRGANIRTI